MTPDEIKSHCMSLPATTHVVQWMGCDVYKVGGKVYGIVAPERGRVTLKCADVNTANFLIEIGVAETAPHLPRGGWVSIGLTDVAPDDLAERLETSYRTIRKGLPAKIRDTLPV